MSLFSLLIALIIGLFGFGIIIADLERRDLPHRTKLLWGGCSGLIIVSGFLFLVVHESTYDFFMNFLYGPEEQVRHPIQQDMPILVSGAVLTGTISVIYFFGSRIQ